MNRDELYDLKIGDKVTYISKNRPWEHGMVKEVTAGAARVVYHCNDEWDNFKDYTGELTRKEYLTKGWV